MASVPATNSPMPSPPEYNPYAAVLSYLVPGLGQIVQGRIGKGLLFLVCLYSLFFYGLFLGRGEAAVIDPNHDFESQTLTRYQLDNNVYLPSARDRNEHFPQANSGFSSLANDLYNRPQFLGQFWMGMVVWPAILQYNFADHSKPHPYFGTFMRTPSVESLNAVHTSRDKLIDLGWVYTVIAGVLNILVIYDALAGPAFLTVKQTT